MVAFRNSNDTSEIRAFICTASVSIEGFSFAALRRDKIFSSSRKLSGSIDVLYPLCAPSNIISRSFANFSVTRAISASTFAAPFEKEDSGFSFLNAEIIFPTSVFAIPSSLVKPPRILESSTPPLCKSFTTSSLNPITDFFASSRLLVLTLGF